MVVTRRNLVLLLDVLFISVIWYSVVFITAMYLAKAIIAGTDLDKVEMRDADTKGFTKFVRFVFPPARGLLGIAVLCVGFLSPLWIRYPTFSDPLAYVTDDGAVETRPFGAFGWIGDDRYVHLAREFTCYEWGYRRVYLDNGYFLYLPRVEVEVQVLDDWEAFFGRYGRNVNVCEQVSEYLTKTILEELHKAQVIGYWNPEQGEHHKVADRLGAAVKSEFPGIKVKIDLKQR